VPNAYISGTGGYVPPRVVTNDDLVNDYGMDTTHEWIVKRTGIEARRFAEEGVGSADLAVPAARDAIAAAGLEPKDIDLIVFATLSPEHCFPGSGVYLQQKLGMVNTPALDVRNQCSGFLYGLTTATGLVRSGVYKHVLVVGGETHSAALDLTTRGRTVSSLFGDGAGAVIVSATEEDRGIRSLTLGADGNHADVLAQRIWDIRKRPFIPQDADGNGLVAPEMMWANMDGRLVFKNAVEKMIMALMEVCWKEGITQNDLDLVFFHQANMRINQFVQRQLGLPDDKVPHNIHKYGNTTAATIPLLLAEAVENGSLKPGMKIGLVAFGSGFTWGAVIIDW
jgi:3-oxoacyl-[acyl-carrier-protein] synthase-3